MFNLTVSAFAASLFGLLQKWPLMAFIAWWALSLVALITFAVVGASVSKISPDADQCAGCGVDFGDPMPPAK